MKKYYTITLQIGLIMTLIIFVILFNYDFKVEDIKIESLFEEQQVIEMEDVEITSQIKTPPPPPRPMIPSVVPNDEVIEDEIIDFTTDLDLYEPIELPPPPKQQEEEVESEIFVVVEQMPELIGGTKSIYEKIKYPDIAIMAGIEGRVIVNFIINEKGETERNKILRKIGGGCDEEALRVSKLLKFKPGKQRGIPVKVNYTLPIIFKIRNNN